MSGPSWLGIGAQRSGTTWLVDLLLQSPDVTLGRSRHKELHSFEHELLSGEADHDARQRWLAEFEVEGLAGEFTPAYLRSPWIAPAVVDLVGSEVPIIVILRDPVDRFESAMRFAIATTPQQQLDDAGKRRRWSRAMSDLIQWTGMYWTHLDAWTQHVDPGTVHVLQYEKVRDAPQPHLDYLWSVIGAQPVQLRDTESPSATATSGDEWSLDRLAGFGETLRRLYRPEVDRLARDWGIDPGLWPKTCN